MLHSSKMLACAGTMLAMTACTTLDAQLQSSGTMGAPDKDYIATAHQLVELDRQAGKLAATKATDPRVQMVASQIMAQADTLSPGLESAERVAGVKPPDTLPADLTAQLAQLKDASGPAFDRQYVAAELAMHQRAVPIFQKEDTDTKAGGMRVQVETELPAVQDNLAKLQILAAEFTGKQG